MTVADLIEALQREPQFLEVYVERDVKREYFERAQQEPSRILAVVPDGSRILLRPADEWVARR